MPGFNLYLSNRLEILVDMLARIVEKPLSSPFKSEIIVVQSKGMERWLSMELAKRFGIWANCRFPFPDNFVWEMFSIFLRDTPDISLFTPQVLSWRIMDVLPDFIDRSEFSRIKKYIGDGINQLKAFQLSERIADVFDRYTVYRPEMLIQWDRQRPIDWQEVLWNRLTQGAEGKNRAYMLYRFLDFIQEYKSGTLKDVLDNKGQPQITEELPERVSIFGISALPDYHLKVIKAISQIIDVHFFFMSPTSEYWGDIVPERKAAKIDRSDLHFEVGNPLLASMGRMGRDFFNAIIEDADEYKLFDEPRGDNLLATIQSDIFHLRWRGKDMDKALVSEDDISIQLHSCHSPMREIEVLYNNLLFLFERYRGLKPRDIIVMTPDIETYAPFISAVFDGYHDERVKIPYSIADRGAVTESPIINVFLKILKLLSSRFYASEVMDIIDDLHVKERFKLKDKDIEAILRWVVDTNIRWGIDEKHRETLGNPRFRDNTWQAGIERLLLGYSMFSKEEELFQGILAYNDMEGDYIETLGHFLEFLSPLFEYSKKITYQYRLDEWAGLLEGILDTFISVNEESARDVQFIRETILTLKKIKASAGFDKTVSYSVILHYLKNRLNVRGFSTGFITGGVTFCEMLPMRSIPFQVVALIGMNNDTYPREYKPLGFDLMAKNPRRGDRSLRDEDRYLFLEAILSARLCLYISYTGQSIKDNSPIPPSVLVSELLDYIEKGFFHPKMKPLDIITKKHPLQAFSPRYFQKDSNIFSYSQEDYEAITANMEKKTVERPFIITPLNEPNVEFRDITNTELKRFFSHPVRYFFNNRLGIFLDEKSIMPKDEEPLELNSLDKFIIRAKLTDKMVSRIEQKKVIEAIYGQGILPPGSPGKVSIDRTLHEAERFFKKIADYIDEKKDPIDFSIDLDDFRIKIRIDDIYSPGMVRYRCSSKIKAIYIIELWIDHVLMGLYSPNRSFYLIMDETHSFKPPEKPRDIIKELLEIYRQGIKMPINFFPETSFSYAEQLYKKGHDAALVSAKNKWKNDRNEEAESDDPYYRFCFGDSDPLDETFTEMARVICGPLIEHID